MTRYVFAAALLIAVAGSALALIPPGEATSTSSPANQTIIEKNQAFPLVGPFVVETCRTETCEEVQT